MIAGIDDYLYKHAASLWSYLACSTMFRTVSTTVGEQTRRFLLVRAGRRAEGGVGRK